MRIPRVLLSLATMTLALVAAPRYLAGQEAPRTVSCRDGTKAVAGDGACHGHGGTTIGSKIKGAAHNVADKTEDAADKTARGAKHVAGDATDKVNPKAVARCKDKSIEHNRSRAKACVGHGGVKKWLDTSDMEP